MTASLTNEEQGNGRQSSLTAMTQIGAMSSPALRQLATREAKSQAPLPLALGREREHECLATTIAAAQNQLSKKNKEREPETDQSVGS